MTLPADRDLEALEATLLRSAAVARLGPRAPLADRERARAILACLQHVTSKSARLIVLARCTPCPPNGDPTRFEQIAADLGVPATAVHRVYEHGLRQIAAALDHELPD